MRVYVKIPIAPAGLTKVFFTHKPPTVAALRLCTYDINGITYSRDPFGAMLSYRYALPALEMTCINYWVENCVIANVFGDKLHRARTFFYNGWLSKCVKPFDFLYC